MINWPICIKSILWRILSTGTTLTVTYIVSHDITTGVSVAMIDMVVSFFLYYIYESLWKYYSVNEPLSAPLLEESKTEEI